MIFRAGEDHRLLDSPNGLCLYNGFMRVGSTRRRKIFYSWKQIAYHLGCNERTCLRWEKELGLPVHRMTTSSKSRVFAYKDELDSWIRENIDSNSRNTKSTSSSLSALGRRSLLLVPILAVLVLAIYYLGFRPGPPPVPEDFRIEGSELVILDGRGRELWRHDTGLERLMDEGHFREHFRAKQWDRENHETRLPTLLMEDLDGDGRTEVLFSPQTDDEFGEGTLTCFDEEGGFLWSLPTARELKFGWTTYSPDYRIRGFSLSDLDGDGRYEILVVSDHNDGFPTRFLVVDSEGEVSGDYWNSGRIEDFITEDLDGDGIREIILCGCNQEFRQACLIVLDASRTNGCSPQSGRFRCQALEPGEERFYIRLPRTDVDLLERENMESVYKLDLLTNRRFSARTRRSGIYFEFDYTFTEPSIRLTSAFEAEHMRASRAGLVRSTLGEEYTEKLLEGILYYDGKDWVTEPARRSVRDLDTR